MTVRIGFDMDGVLADFSTAFREVESRLFGAASAVAAESPEVEAQHEDNAARQATAPAAPAPRELRRRRDAIWKDIRETPDFWSTLGPHDPEAVRRIHDMMLRYRWEVFFITQRPATAGETVQRQTQHWLRAQGFDLPSVLAITGSRGAAAGALRLDYHVDDSPQNCLDIVSESRARPILIVPEPDEITENSAKRFNISVARSIGEALDVLDAAVSVPGGDARSGLLNRLSRMVRGKA
jgi:hypothetical protein